MARTFVELPSFGALEVQLGLEPDVGRLADDYLGQHVRRRRGTLETPSPGAAALPLCPQSFGVSGT